MTKDQTQTETQKENHVQDSKSYLEETSNTKPKQKNNKKYEEQEGLFDDRSGECLHFSLGIAYSGQAQPRAKKRLK